MRISLDTNILAYAEGIGDERRCRLAREVVAALPVESVLIPVQVLGELHRVLAGKSDRTPASIKDAVLGWADAFSLGDSTRQAMEDAFDLAADHQLQIWDALILSVSAEHKCRLLLSEDLQNGFTCRGVTVSNPFIDPIHPLLKSILAYPGSDQAKAASDKG